MPAMTAAMASAPTRTSLPYPEFPFCLPDFTSPLRPNGLPPQGFSLTAIFRIWSELIGGRCGFVRTGFVLVVGPENAERLLSNLAMLRDLGINTYALNTYFLFIVRLRNSCINDPIRSTSSSNAKWPVSKRWSSALGISLL
jgi:hypothetical protein